MHSVIYTCMVELVKCKFRNIYLKVKCKGKGGKKSEKID